MNYYSTFIEVAEDCLLEWLKFWKLRAILKTIPVLQYEMIANQPYARRRGLWFRRLHSRNYGINQMAF
jgi:hypothetical protein